MTTGSGFPPQFIKSRNPNMLNYFPIVVLIINILGKDDVVLWYFLIVKSI